MRPSSRTGGTGAIRPRVERARNNRQRKRPSSRDKTRNHVPASAIEPESYGDNMSGSFSINFSGEARMAESRIMTNMATCAKSARAGRRNE
jgi:hypothetical protein